MAEVSRSPWLPFPVPPGAETTLLCLPHAGAGAGTYRAWGADLWPRVGACPVQPPGREKRHREDPIRSAARYVGELAPEVVSRIRAPYAVFGHSTGAVCAFELVRQLRHLGWAMPERLFVSGRRPPHVPMPRHPLAKLSIEELAAFLAEMGGTPQEMLADHRLLRRLQPLLDADFQVNEEYEHHPQEPLPVPITAFASTDDEWATQDVMEGWAVHTSADFEVCTLSGGHFAVFEQSKRVHDVITTRLEGLS